MTLPPYTEAPAACADTKESPSTLAADGSALSSAPTSAVAGGSLADALG